MAAATPRPTPGPSRLSRALPADAPVAAGSLLLLAVTVGLVLATAGHTLGYDYGCYEHATRQLLDGRPIYDNAFSIGVGTCPGTYTYPPPFAVALVPWLVFGSAGAALWSIAMAICFLAGVALLPVRRDVRWLVVVLAAVNWPLLYSVKLGQVGPILFLLFAAVWRWIDRPGPVGVATAVGALVKVQPAVLVIWAFATGRRKAAAVALLVAAVLVAATAVITGPGAWATYLDLLRGLSGTLTTQHNFAPGAVAHLAGLSDAAASAIQLAATAAAAAAMVVAWRFTSAEASLQVTIVASQLLSSPLRDHYAVLLLLPTAWLVARGHTWAAIFPLVGWASLFAQEGEWLPAATVPLAFFGCLAAVLVVALGSQIPDARPVAGVAGSRP